MILKPRSLEDFEEIKKICKLPNRNSSVPTGRLLGLKMKINLTTKFVMVLFAVMLLPNHTLPKPFTSQELEQKDQNFAEKELEASHAVNGTSAIRVKRSKECDELTKPWEYLKCWCPAYTGPGSSSRGCVKARYNCRGFAEAVCEGYSFACHSNIGQHGFPRCFHNHVWLLFVGPYFEPQEQDETQQIFTAEKEESNQSVQNETSGFRGKREVAYNLRDFCQAAGFQPSTSANSCVKGRYYCYEYAEMVCNIVSFQCLSNVPQYGYPKCSPVYDFVVIDLGGKGKRKVRRTKACHCA
ncbi:hypothetical protein ACROYT_G002395 [Oculina patagonica]